ncbi:MAG: aminotransferase class I/II-fold pyridoxal phosphate-dependent enzyme [Bacillota bacterium]|nr:MAG: aminotransferase class I/II-fold pyridoxal phosphate-dependent enzyme [Bacillota bacterium]
MKRDDVVARMVQAKRAGEQGWEIRSRLAEMGRGKKDLIQLSSADPDMPSPPKVLEAAARALKEGKTRYTEPTGLLALREKVAEHLLADGTKYDPRSEVVITAGTGEALSAAFRAVLNPGDEVLITDPYYPGHVVTTYFAGAKPVLVAAGPEAGFVPRMADLEAAVSDRTRLLVITNPSNPGGVVYTRKQLEAFASFAVKHDLLVVSDEIYKRFNYTDKPFISFASVPGIWDRVITVGSFSKAYAMTGFRVGWAAAPAEIASALGEVKHNSSLSTCTISQYAALAAFDPESEAYAEEIRATFGRRRKLFMDGIEKMGLKHNNPGTGYVVLVDLGGKISTNAVRFAEVLVSDFGVSLWPGPMFGTTVNDWLRIGLVKPEPLLAETLVRIKKCLRLLA